jgi:hypothetical protein
MKTLKSVIIAGNNINGFSALNFGFAAWLVVVKNGEYLKISDKDGIKVELFVDKKVEDVSSFTKVLYDEYKSSLFYKYNNEVRYIINKVKS